MSDTPNLDKFYTKPEVALRQKSALFHMLGRDRPKHTLEPSVGSGAFIEERDGIVAFDLMPDFPGALQIDSIHPEIPAILKDAGITDLLVIGNPPFGFKGALAAKFISTFLSVGGIVAYILPLTCRRHSFHKLVEPDEARLIFDWDVDENSFELPDGKPYKVRACFQVWSTRACDARHADLRIRSKPPISHPDFTIVQYNGQNDRNACLSWDYDFVVASQGYGDYRTLYPKGENPPGGKSRHFVAVKAHSAAALVKLKRIDFEALSRTNTVRPGFRKWTLVDAYSKL